MTNSKVVFFLVALCFASLVLGKTDISRPDKRTALKPSVAVKPAERNCTDCVGSLTVFSLNLVKKGNLNR